MEEQSRQTYIQTDGSAFVSDHYTSAVLSCCAVAGGETLAVRAGDRTDRRRQMDIYDMRAKGNRHVFVVD